MTITLSGMDIDISVCNLGFIRLIVQNGTFSHKMVESPIITIHNSSFGHVDLKPGTEAYITECYIDSSLASRPVLITSEKSKLTIQDSYFSNFVNEEGPTIVHGHSSSTIAIQFSKFLNNRGSYGTVSLHDNCSLSMNNAEFLQNTATEGAAIFGQKVTVNTNDCTFANNSASREGASLHKDSKSMMIGVTFLNNSATESNGGSIHLQHSYYLQISNSKFVGNSAKEYGGSIHVDNSSELTLNNVTFHKKKSAHTGGAVMVRNSKETNIQHGDFTQNMAIEGAGAISLERTSSNQISDCLFIENRAQKTWERDSIFQWIKNFDVENDSLIDIKILDGFGGAICIYESVHLMVVRSFFERNRAWIFGGAIAGKNNVSVTIQECEFTENSAAGSGGAMAFGQEVKCKLRHVIGQQTQLMLQGEQ